MSHMYLIEAKNHRYGNCIEIEYKLLLLRNKKSFTCLIRVLFLSIYLIRGTAEYFVLKIPSYRFLIMCSLDFSSRMHSLRFR